MRRGNFRSSWAAEGGYDFVAEALFNDLEVDGFFLEYDDERSGTFELLQGFVRPRPGHDEARRPRARRAQRRISLAGVPLEQLCLSPQCGFSSTVERGRS